MRIAPPCVLLYAVSANCGADRERALARLAFERDSALIKTERR